MEISIKQKDSPESRILFLYEFHKIVFDKCWKIIYDNNIITVMIIIIGIRRKQVSKEVQCKRESKIRRREYGLQDKRETGRIKKTGS